MLLFCAFLCYNVYVKGGDNLMDLKDFLKKDRESKGLSQTSYAKILGIARGTLAHLEQGRTPSPSTTRSLIKHFGKPLDELLGKEKINKLSTLETTNMLIDRLIQQGEIKEDFISKNAKVLIENSLKLEIDLKLKMMKSK